MVDLTSEQQQIVRGIVKNVKKKEEQVITFGGTAGCGKTTCLGVIAEVLPSFAICAYTGKAANVLRKKGMASSTIHSLIYKPVQAMDGHIEFLLKEPTEISCDGFLVDEASMVSKDIYQDLLSFNLPIIFVGDHGQLEPVGQDVNVMADPMFRLETVHRNAGEIAHFAEHLRKGRTGRTFQGGAKVKFVEPTKVTDDLRIKTDQMICAYNKTRVEVNEQVREYLKRKKLLVRGERVMCLRNNKRLGLFNGMQGQVVKVHPKHPRMDFWSDGVTYTDIMFDANQFGKEKNQFEWGIDSPNPFDYAYCITAHKSQGDEFPSVLVFEEQCSKWDMKRWNYTAASRAKDTLIWVCPKQHIPAWL